MDALSEFLVGNWVDLLERGMIKAPPKGSVLQVRGESSSADPGRVNAPDPRTPRTPLPVTETPGMAYQVCPIMDEQTGEIYNQVLAISRSSIGMQTLCYWCGGRGHPVSIDISSKRSRIVSSIIGRTDEISVSCICCRVLLC